MVEPLSDRSKFWAASPDWATAEIRRDDWRARAVLGLGQVLVSGRIAGAVEALAPGAPEVGLWGVVEANGCAVRIARDRALIVSAEPLTVEPGWRDGWAATPADDVYAVLEIDGTGLQALVCEATSADLDAGSPSAAIMFAGIACLLYRTGQATARLHVERPLATYVWHWLERRDALPSPLVGEGGRA
jgi:Sarcosine oxidase, gamma subunit family